ncbi:MAG: beta-ketoacyl synthase N-terminal-like domain-containing protein [Planctomycetota bacterium]
MAGTVDADDTGDSLGDGESIPVNDSRRVLDVLSRARRQIEELKRPTDQRIAIIGMACRFPGAESVAEFWEMLRDGREGIRDLTDQELADAGVSAQLASDPNYVRRVASFANPAGFDAGFFGYSPGEAELIDPQHRVLIECAWTALEDAGYDTKQYPGDIGVYAGAALNSYLVNLHNDRRTRESVNQVQAVVSNVLGLMPTRVSYHLDLRGPSVGIQTGCSTSLVAIHQACRSLLDGQCEMALAGGVTIGQVKPAGYLYEEGSIASPDGCCRAFDADGKGTMFGNGVGIVVLKPLAKAIADGDSIRAVILGSAVNNDGSDKVGLLAPSVGGQSKVVSDALTRAAIDPVALSYHEAHGTATELGDPIEFAALDQSIGQALEQAGKRCAIGSVKSNIGHLDAAAGVAGLIKVALSLQNQAIPASLGFTKSNPSIDLANRPFEVNTRLTSWPRGDAPRRAGVSSFGMGGTNAHAVLEEAPATDSAPEESESSDPSSAFALPLSAKTETALKTRRQDLAEHLLAHGDSLGLPDVGYTLQVGRRAMRYRDVIVCKSIDEAVQQLQQDTSSSDADSAHSVALMFSGQGSQFIGMARGLLASQPKFAETIATCGDIFGRADFVELITSDRSTLRNTAEAQPILFAVEYALADLLMSWGVRPAAMIGHSLGQYVAACLAGVFSLEDALPLVQFRGEAMQRCEPGSMLAVFCDQQTLKSLLPELVNIAVVNGPDQLVVSGPNNDIAELQSELNRRKILSQRLETSHAFHSAMMDPALEPFLERLQQVQFNAPEIDIVSNLTGTWMTAEEAMDPSQWMNHLRHPVLFGDGVQTITKRTGTLLLEIGPGQTLCKIAERQVKDVPTIQTMAGRVDRHSDNENLTRAIAELWRRGVSIRWSETHQQTFQRVPLPTYPFERTTHYIEPSHPSDVSADPPASSLPSSPAGNGGERASMDEWFHIPTWRLDSSSKHARDHRNVGGPVRRVVFGNQALCDLLVARADEDDQTILVTAGHTFDQTKSGFTIDPTNRDDHKKLWQKLRKPELPTQLIVAWLSNTPNDACSIKSHELDSSGYLASLSLRESRPLRAGEGEFRKLIALAKSLQDPTFSPTLSLDVITGGIFPILSEETRQDDAALIPGFISALPHEIPELKTRLIDAENFGSAHDMHMIASELLRDEYTGNPVALRGRSRFVRDFETTSFSESECPLLNRDATYLVVGDLLDGLGMVYAGSLRKYLNAKLIVVGSSELPSTDQWDRWLATHGNQHPSNQLIHGLKSLGREGDDFTFMTANLSDAESISSAIQRGLAVLDESSLQGVFHSDVMGGEASCSLAELDDIELDRIVHHRQQQVSAIWSSIQSHAPEFLVLQSSLSVLVGGPGLSAYAAANSFIDRFAEWRTVDDTDNASRSDCQIISINWDAVQLDSSEEIANSRLMSGALTADDVWEATRRILAQPIPNIAVSARPLGARLAAASHVTVESPNTNLPPRNNDPAFVAPETPVQKAVASAMSDLLGIKKIGLHDDFFALGGHSLLAIQAITKLRKEFEVEIPMRAILQGKPTVAGIAEVIEENLPQLTEDDASIVVELLQAIEKDKSQESPVTNP